MNHWKQVRTSEDIDYSYAEDLRIQIKKLKKENPDNPEIEGLEEELDSCNEDDYSELLYKIMK